jgi:hypothetical protein
MSTDYVSSELITVSDLLGGRLDKCGITDGKSPKADKCQRCLTDGDENYLWAYGERFIGCFTRWMPNGRPGFMLQAIANEFDVEIFSEHDEETPSYVPLGKPTDDEIAAMRSEWWAECKELDREKEFRAKLREERAAAS